MKRFGVGVDTEDADFLADADSSSDTGKTIKDTNVELFVSAWPNQSTAVHVALGSSTPPTFSTSPSLSFFLATVLCWHVIGGPSFCRSV